MLGLLTFARSPLGRYAVIGVALLVLVASIFEVGYRAAKSADTRAAAAASARAAKAIQKREATADAITTTTAARTAQARVLVRTVTKTLVEKVHDYVPPAADARCVVPVGFVQLYNAAAAGLPRPAGGPDETPSGVALSTVAETDVENFGVAYDWRAEALGWRDWYVTQKAAWDRR
jgi:hypothetical protein